MSQLDNDALNEIIENALLWSKADACLVVANSKQRTRQDFTRSKLRKISETNDLDLIIRARYGRREGEVRINQYDQAALKKAVKQAEFIAKAMPVNREITPWPRKVSDPENVLTWSVLAHKVQAEDLAKTCASLLGSHTKSGFELDGYIENHVDYLMLRTLQGVKLTHKATNYLCEVSAWSDTKRIAAKASQSGTDILRDNLSTVFTEALDKAQLAVSQHSLPAGSYSVIFESEAMQALLSPLIKHFDAREIAEGRSYFSGKNLSTLGWDRRLSITSDPYNSASPAIAWDDDANLLKPISLVSEGRFGQAYYSPFYAKQQRKRGPFKPSNILVAGQKMSVPELISKSDRTLVVSRIADLQVIDEKALHFQACTSGGLAFVEDGKVRYVANDFVCDIRLAELFASIEEVGGQKRINAKDGLSWLIPSFKVRNVPLIKAIAQR